MVWKNSQANDEGEGFFEWKIGSRITLSWKWRNHDTKAHKTCLRLKLYKCVCVCVMCKAWPFLWILFYFVTRASQTTFFDMSFWTDLWQKTRTMFETCYHDFCSIFCNAFGILPWRDIQMSFVMCVFVCCGHWQCSWSRVEVDQTDSNVKFFLVVLPYSHGKRSERGCHVPIGNLDQRVSWKKSCMLRMDLCDIHGIWKVDNGCIWLCSIVTNKTY